MSAVDDSTSSRRHLAVEAAAARLHKAARTATPCPPVRDRLGAEDVAAAYEMQELLVAESASVRNGIDVRGLLLEAGRRWGQEDMLIDIALELLTVDAPR